MFFERQNMGTNNDRLVVQCALFSTRLCLAEHGFAYDKCLHLFWKSTQILFPNNDPQDQNKFYVYFCLHSLFFLTFLTFTLYMILLGHDPNNNDRTPT